MFTLDSLYVLFEWYQTEVPILSPWSVQIVDSLVNLIFIKLSILHDCFSLVHFNLIFLCLSVRTDFCLSFFYVNPNFIQQISYKYWLLFWCISFSFVVHFLFSRHIPLILFIVSIDSSFVEAMFSFNEVCQTTYWGLQELSFNFKPICLSRLQLVFVLEMEITRSFHYFFFQHWVIALYFLLLGLEKKSYC